MANEIHNYSIERFVFGDDDYYDIDWFDGSVYRTAKIKGSVIKSGVNKWQTPKISLTDAHLHGTSTLATNTTNGYKVTMNATGSPATVDLNIELQNNDIEYDGSTFKLFLFFQMQTNTGGNIQIDTTGFFAQLGTNAQTGGTTQTTNIDTTGLSANRLYVFDLATFSGSANAKFLMTTIQRITGGNIDKIDLIGIQLKKQ
jgi:hypothetical protein